MQKTNGHARAAKQKVILEALKAGNTRRAAAAYAHTTPDTFYRWLASDQTFSDAVARAEAEAELEMVDIVRTAAKEGYPSAAQWWLEHHPSAKRDWRRVEEINVGKLSVEQLIALATVGDPGAESAGDRMAAATAASEPAE